MEYIRSSSTMWRATCSFPKYQSDIYSDYVRAQISEVDILKFIGFGLCRAVDHVNIRGNVGVNTTVPFWQVPGFTFHIDSSDHRCKFDARNGCIADEDSFGFYVTTNSAFRCTESDESTTQYWFGANV